MQDNAPIHTAANYLMTSKVITVLPHPPRSPDLNPIMHMWTQIERDLRGNSAIFMQVSVKRVRAQVFPLHLYGAVTPPATILLSAGRRR